MKIKKQIEKATSDLLKMAKDICWNEISNNCFYILTEINPENDLKFSNRKLYKKINDKKELKKIDEIIEDLKIFYFDIYDINLFVYKSTKNKTIIDLRYFLKVNSGHNIDKIKETEPMIHSRITLPFYRKNEKEKFDVNWELGGVKQEWKMFLGKLKYYIRK